MDKLQLLCIPKVLKQGSYSKRMHVIYIACYIDNNINITSK